MGYTDEQKMMRIAHLSADILRDEPSSIEMKYNYMLGEVLKAGCGVCRHRATLTKVLCDALLPDVSCVLIAGKVPVAVPMYFGKGGRFSGFMHISGDASIASARHAWNVVQIRGRNYVVDPMQACLFAADDPPGEKLNEYGENIGQKEMLEYYGVEHLGQNPFRLCIIEDDPVMREHAIKAARAKLEQGSYGRVLKLEIEAPTTYAELQESLKRVGQGRFHFVLVDNDLSQYPDHQRGCKTGMALVNEVIEQARAEERYLGRNTTFYPNSSNNRHLRGGIFNHYNRVTDRKNGPMVFDYLGDSFERQARKRYSRFRSTEQQVDALELPERPNSPRTV